MDAAYREKIKKICIAAAAAPSGDNSQPWRFVFRAPHTLEFHALVEKDNELLNVEGSGTYIALGAAIQNAELEAKALGFAPHIEYSDTSSLVATMTLSEGGVLSKEEILLHGAITRRHSNRKPYTKKPLAEEHRKALESAARGSDRVTCTFIEDTTVMRPVSRALTTMEQVALQNKTLHQLFFGSIFWSKERNVAGESGLYIDTLELPPPPRLLFKVLKYWPVAKTLANIGFPLLVAKTNAEQNVMASAFGLLTLSRFERKSYLEAGRVLERVWLAATAQGLSLQIVTGMLFCARAIEQGTAPIFSEYERALVQKAYAQTQSLLGVTDPFLMFRVGYADAPSAVSFRKEPIVDGLH